QNGAYVWNSTYDGYKNAQIRNSAPHQELIQDVSHGNHVVNYIIASYKNDIGNWSKQDIQRLIRTFRLNIYKADGRFADNVDGTFRSIGAGSIGWKFTDGWMKLVEFDSSLYPLFEQGYSKNRAQFRNTLFDFQYQFLLR